MTKKKYIVLPKVVYKYNLDIKTPNIEVNKKNDYDRIRDIVEGNDSTKNNKMIPLKTDEKIVSKIINKFQIV
jgi:hypothetical protein